MLKQYWTDTGIFVPAVTRTQMKELDRIAIEETGPNLYQMMENAGRSLALAALDMLDEQRKQTTVVVLAGSGGNGGGGICAARHLANRGQRIDVHLCLSSPPEKIGDVPSYQRKIFGSTQGKECELDQLANVEPDLIIDALLGYSLQGAPTGKTAELIQWANESDIPMLSLDIPSGVDSTTGETPGQFINAARTVTLALPKTGLFPATTGRLWLADIGIPQAAFQKLGLDYISPFENRFLIPLQHN